ncbi:hypothetical protein BD779DRAFT_1673833 [Infundibulicybe gibba]|nr:hypothetical protein BD779DRAFT_1673833 [Infundibulicybe gibba]
MPAVFTQQIAVEQGLEERQRALDAERLDNIQKTKNCVIGYAWTIKSPEAVVFEFQGGFTFPYFVITLDVLSNLELPIAGDDNPCVKLYNHTVMTWTKVKVGHVITLKGRECIFLKALDVTECHDFDNLLSRSKASESHIRKNLPQERAHVRRALQQDDLSTCHIARPRPLIAPALGSRTTSSHCKVKVEQLESPLELSDSDSDDLSAASTIICPAPKRIANTRNSSITTTTPPIVHPAPTKIPTKRQHSDSNSDSGSSSSSDSETMPLSPSRSISPVAGQTPNHAIYIDEDLPIWPVDFYVVDIVLGFAKCEAARRSRSNVGQTFTSLFGVPFRRSTFYENRKRWEDASQASRDKSLKAGRTDKGLWSAFLAQNRLQTGRHQESNAGRCLTTGRKKIHI